MCGMSRRRERGAALVMALWFSAAAAILAMAFLQGARTQNTIAAGALGATRARLAEEAAVAWSAARLLAEEVVLEPGGTALTWSLGDIRLDILVSAESGRIDVNYAAVETLMELAGKLGVAAEEVEALGEALRKWRKEDEPEGVRIERPPLGSRLLPPVRRRLERVAELRMVPGMPPAAYAALAPWLTVQTREAMPDSGLLPSLLQLTPRRNPALEPGRNAGGSPVDEVGEEQSTDGDEAGGTAGDGQAQRPAGDRRTDPLQLYRLLIATHQPVGYTSRREVVLWLRPGHPRPYRILEWSAPLVATEGRESP